MRKLLQALASWKGPERFGEEIANRGLFVPQTYRHEMIDYCHANCFDSDLETYWSECAKEWVLSGGRVDSNRRRHLEDAPYRSVYLDQLAAAREQMPPSDVPELHPCLRFWIVEKKKSGERLGRALWEKLEETKDEERKRHRISRIEWTGKKRDVKPILRHFTELRGFAEKKLKVRGLEGGGMAFCKETPSGLVFYCWVDSGGFPDTGARLPLHFHVSHAEDNLLPLGAGPNAMYVGADYYAVFKSPSNAVFGVFALVEIFDAFHSTFL